MITATSRSSPPASCRSRGSLPQRSCSPSPFGRLIAAITPHIPDQSFQLVRYYGWYSNKMRGQRNKRAPEPAGQGNSRFGLTGALLSGAICLIGFVVIKLRVTETTGKSLEDIERELVD